MHRACKPGTSRSRFALGSGLRSNSCSSKRPLQSTGLQRTKRRRLSRKLSGRRRGYSSCNFLRWTESMCLQSKICTSPCRSRSAGTYPPHTRSTRPGPLRNTCPLSSSGTRPDRSPQRRYPQRRGCTQQRRWMTRICRRGKMRTPTRPTRPDRRPPSTRCSRLRRRPNTLLPGTRGSSCGQSLAGTCPRCSSCTRRRPAPTSKSPRARSRCSLLAWKRRSRKSKGRPRSLGRPTRVTRRGWRSTCPRRTRSTPQMPWSPQRSSICRQHTTSSQG